jgi:hypothetical protein
MSEPKRLVDVLPPEFTKGQYEDSPAMPHVFIDVIAEHRDDRPWPGNHRYVKVWFVLANGKAVGWNDNPTRGWSFPVINYPKREPATEPVALRFQSTLHGAFHLVLVKQGFSFVVSSKLLIGFDYRHPETGISVVLTPVDDDLEYGAMKPDGSHVYTKEDYTPEEWLWMENSADDVERLERDLFILIDTRPAKMQFPQRIAEGPET